MESQVLSGAVTIPNLFLGHYIFPFPPPEYPQVFLEDDGSSFDSRVFSPFIGSSFSRPHLLHNCVLRGGNDPSLFSPNVWLLFSDSNARWSFPIFFFQPFKVFFADYTLFFFIVRLSVSVFEFFDPVSAHFFITASDIAGFFYWLPAAYKRPSVADSHRVLCLLVSSPAVLCTVLRARRARYLVISFFFFVFPASLAISFLRLWCPDAPSSFPLSTPNHPRQYLPPSVPNCVEPSRFSLGVKVNVLAFPLFPPGFERSS